VPPDRPLCSAPENPVCNDALGNDRDDLIDYPSDPQCRAASGQREHRKRCGLLGIEILAVLAGARRRRSGRSIA
jgi:hypothetical protein